MQQRTPARRPGTAAGLAMLFLCGLGLAAYGALSSGAVLATVAKPEEKPERRRCCPLGVAYNSGGGRVVLDQICRNARATIVHLRLAGGLSAACTHPAGTILKDQSGRRYRMTAFTGLPSCASGDYADSPNARFTWTFEPLANQTRKITLLEVEDEVTQGLVFWGWRDVDVSHCRF
jgi:hypothetical protein